MQLRKPHGIAHGNHQSFLLRVAGGVVETKPRVLLVSLYPNPLQHLKAAAYRHCVPPGRSYTLSLVEYSSSNGLVGRLGPAGIGSFFVGSVLHLFLLVTVIIFATQKTAALLTYRTRPMFGGILACCALYYLWATTRQMSLKPSCACVA